MRGTTVLVEGMISTSRRKKTVRLKQRGQIYLDLVVGGQPDEDGDAEDDLFPAVRGEEEDGHRKDAYAHAVNVSKCVQIRW